MAAYWPVQLLEGQKTFGVYLATFGFYGEN